MKNTLFCFVITLGEEWKIKQNKPYWLPSPDLHPQEDERINRIDLTTVVMHIVYAPLIGTKK